ncbi:hypothetical protein LCGC14_1406980 [marine sediment metagenome]|uniref:Uncharacterized protein n=1 Tax=marine sediment metagenome TaxID=412755 RepID=A0A0F9JVG1_9ZZZZ
MMIILASSTQLITTFCTEPLYGVPASPLVPYIFTRTVAHQRIHWYPLRHHLFLV